MPELLFWFLVLQFLLSSFNCTSVYLWFYRENFICNAFVKAFVFDDDDDNVGDEDNYDNDNDTNHDKDRLCTTLAYKQFRGLYSSRNSWK